jgi:hypothetical protein
MPRRVSDFTRGNVCAQASSSTIDPEISEHPVAREWSPTRMRSCGFVSQAARNCVMAVQNY